MKVFYRIALVLLMISSGSVLIAQTKKADSVKTKDLRVRYFNPQGGLFTFGKALKSKKSPIKGWTNGVYVATSIRKDSLSAMPKYYTEDNDFLKVNGPVEEGRPVILRGKILQANSVDIAITNEEGQAVNYKETEVVFDEKKGELSIHTALPTGIYTLQVPVVDGVAVKTVIVQKAYPASWRIKKN